MHPRASFFHCWWDSGAEEHSAEGPLFMFLLFKIKIKRQASWRQSSLRCSNFCHQVSHSATSASDAKTEKSHGKTCLTFIPRHFFLISSKMTMNTPRSLHSAGANPPLEALGNLVPSCGCDLSTQALLRALVKGPQWTEGLSLFGALLHL